MSGQWRSNLGSSDDSFFRRSVDVETTRVAGRVDGTDLDQQLIHRLAEGDATALEMLYDRHARVAFVVIFRVVADRQAAEDLVQEAFVRVWQHAGSYNGSLGGVRSWLLAIAHNLALNELRRRRRHPADDATHRSDDEAVVAMIPATAADPADAAWAQVRQTRLSHALADLPPPQRTVVALYAAGHSQSEIAAHLDEPLGTVKTRMRRGMLRLRDILRREGYDLE